MTDSLDVLLRDLAMKDSGWHRHENPETGAVAYFPETAKSAEDFERRALAMHESQEPVTLAPKPREDHMAARKRIARGD